MRRVRQEGLINLLARRVAAVRVNRVEPARIAGRDYLRKRRKTWAAPVVLGGNMFLWASRSGIRMPWSARAWQNWELASDALLYPQGPRMLRAARGAILITPFEGYGLAHYLERPERWPAAFEAAGRELRRAHALRSPLWSDGWSHGDLHLDNILYDERSGAARLIDFETAHEAGLPARERHADDLLVLLLDLLGRNRAESWAGQALLLLRAYGRPEILPALCARLRPPVGVARVLWSIRTHGLGRAALAARLATLRLLVMLAREEQP